ncbi:hypothetical protein RCS94_02510 [Orbaceae bacterium ac157xtp]
MMKKLIIALGVLACSALIYCNFPYSNDPTFDDLLELANKGNVEAQITVGEIYYNGLAIDNESLNKKEYKNWDERVKALDEALMQSREESIKWFKLAAEQGDAKGQYYLGLLGYEGEF